MIGGGHYVSYVKNRTNQQWYCFNDSSCKPVKENVLEQCSSSAYLLFYERDSLNYGRYMPNVEGKKQVANESSLPNDGHWCPLMWFCLWTNWGDNRDYSYFLLFSFFSNFIRSISLFRSPVLLCCVIKNHTKFLSSDKTKKRLFCASLTIEISKPVFVYISSSSPLYSEYTTKTTKHVRFLILCKLLHLFFFFYLLFLCIYVKMYTQFSRQKYQRYISSYLAENDWEWNIRWILKLLAHSIRSWFCFVSLVSTVKWRPLFNPIHLFIAQSSLDYLNRENE